MTRDDIGKRNNAVVNDLLRRSIQTKGTLKAGEKISSRKCLPGRLPLDLLSVSHHGVSCTKIKRTVNGQRGFMLASIQNKPWLAITVIGMFYATPTAIR
jgi:hypothetical protein